MSHPVLRLKKEIKYEIIGILLLTFALFSLVSLINLGVAGPVGDFLNRLLTYMCGQVGGYMIPMICGLAGIYFIAYQRPLVVTPRFIGVLLGCVLTLMVLHFPIPDGMEILPQSLPAGGGLIGGVFVWLLRKAVGRMGLYIICAGLLMVAALLITNSSLAAALLGTRARVTLSYRQMRAKMKNDRQAITEDTVSLIEQDSLNDTAMTSRFGTPISHGMPIPVNPYVDDLDSCPQQTSLEFNSPPQSDTVSVKAQKCDPGQLKNTAETLNFATATAQEGCMYRFPPSNLLNKARVANIKSNHEIHDNARILEETLNSFHVSAKVIHISQGPAVTRYELQPAAGVKVSRIVSLADDLALKLAASGVRIEAPIPGKAAVGIEVPNKNVSSVLLRDILESGEFQNSHLPIAVALGKDIAGTPQVTDLSKMPHLLVAGATGSGKSVCINTFILSILYKAHPDEVKLLLIDPKMVELSSFNGIPHLVAPVVTDAKKAAGALGWAVREMERRYALFARDNVREIKRYNEITAEEKLPYVVIIIDELADLMMVSPVDVEDAICRLAQMARACGIHLVLATQRPSVDVITGTIKANIPSRVAFAVSSQVDSRTILDMAGAEKLLGKGDMLFYPVGANKPLRLQGAFVSDQEVEKVVEYVKMQRQPQYQEGVITEAVEEQHEVDNGDELLNDAIKLILETGHASTSMLQRKFRIGYTRAARLIDMMEEMRIVGPSLGSKARDIIMTSEQVYAKYINQRPNDQ